MAGADEGYYSDYYYTEDDPYYSSYYYSEEETERLPAFPSTPGGQSGGGVGFVSARTPSGIGGGAIGGRTASGVFDHGLGDRTTTGLGGRTQTGLKGRTLSGVAMMTGQLNERTTTVYVDFDGSVPASKKTDGEAGGEKAEEVVYYNQKVANVLTHFKTNITTGLTAAEAARRQEEWGPNALPSPPPKAWYMILLNQFKDFMILVLCFVALFSLALQDFVEAAVLILVVLMNVVIGFVQEVKAERALSALESLTAASAKVFRDSAWANVAGAELVPGDIVALEEGDNVPADLRLFEVNGLEVDEAKLTGETELVKKHDQRIAHEGIGAITVGDRQNMAFSSTLVSTGVATGVVVNTGTRTQIGKISEAVSEKTEKDAPMQSKLALLGKVLVLVSVLLCALVIAIGIVRVRVDNGKVTGKDWELWSKVGISLAVAVIPEGLIAVVTVALALAVMKMGRLNAVVRNMPAVETLGSTTVICTDKTGTLTYGKMQSQHLFAGGVEYSISGEGIIPEGKFSIAATGEELNPAPRALPPALYAAIQICALCNNSAIAFDQESQKWASTGDTTEVALEVAARKLDLGFDAWKGFGLVKDHEVPFNSKAKRMTSVYRLSRPGPRGEPAGGMVIAAKGAMDFMISSCVSYMNDDGSVVPMTPQHLAEIEETNAAISSRGLRTLCLAYRLVAPADIGSVSRDDPETVEHDLVFAGLIALRDPPRESCQRAVAKAKKAGVRIIMMTGDHPKTAASIGKQLGIVEEGEDDLVKTGMWVDSMSHDDLVNLEVFPKVLARVSPTNKLSLVKALRARGNIVAMTGDGTNDAPSIRHASVGIAMGLAGTDLTVQAADIVLLDDKFETIIEAVELGRGVLDNVTLYCLYLLSCNLSEILSMMAAAIAGINVPFSAIMILYANVIVDVPPSIALGIDIPDKNIMDRLPRNPKAPIFGYKGAFIIVSQALLISAITMFVYVIHIYVIVYELDQGNLEAKSHARSLAFMTQAAIHLFHSYVSRSASLSVFRKDIFENKILNYGVAISFVILAVVCYIPGLNDVLDQWPMNFRDWGFIIGAVIVHILGTEVIKTIFIRGIFAAPPTSDDPEAASDKPKFYSAF